MLLWFFFLTKIHFKTLIDHEMAIKQTWDKFTPLGRFSKMLLCSKRSRSIIISFELVIYFIISFTFGLHYLICFGYEESYALCNSNITPISNYNLSLKTKHRKGMVAGTQFKILLLKMSSSKITSKCNYFENTRHPSTKHK